MEIFRDNRFSDRNHSSMRKLRSQLLPLRNGKDYTGKFSNKTQYEIAFYSIYDGMRPDAPPRASLVHRLNGSTSLAVGFWKISSPMIYKIWPRDYLAYVLPRSTPVDLKCLKSRIEQTAVHAARNLCVDQHDGSSGAPFDSRAGMSLKGEIRAELT